MTAMKISPIDDYIKEGFSQQMIEQFRCPAIFVSSPDKLRNLQTLLGNSQPSYPYIFLFVQSVGPNINSYATNRFARQGIRVALNTDNNQFQMARLIPVVFEIEVSFITDKMASDEVDSVNGFIRRWLFARRNGSLQFNVNYGLTSVSISYTLSDTVPIQPRESPTDQESFYTVVTTASVQGYVSEPELGTRGRINQIQLAETHPEVSPGSTFFKF